jgi:hypothetical protein
MTNAFHLKAGSSTAKLAEAEPEPKENQDEIAST